MSEKFYVGQDLVSFANNGTYKPVSRVTLMIDDENCVTAGDDTGMELVATCYHATQEMADALLAQFNGYEYPAFEAVAANLDPSAELGDGITADGHYSVISRLSDDGSGYPSPSAPGEAEMEDEYPSAGPMTQKFNRQLAQTRSLISKTAEEISLEVQGIADQYTKLAVTLDGVTVMDESGTTLIKGSSIQTDTLYVNAANITGTLTASQIDATDLVLTNSANIANNFIVDSSGNVTMNGTLDLSGASSITWNSSNSPVKYQFSVNGTSSWHDTMTSSDYYRRDSLDGGVTWGTAYQFRGKNGTNGSNGSDASVPLWIEETCIDATSVESFHIKGNKIEAVCPTGSTDTGFILTGAYANSALQYLRIYAVESISPNTHFCSPCGGYAYWDFGHTYFSDYVSFTGPGVFFSNGAVDFYNSTVDFSGATVTGLTATAVFG